MLKIIIDWFRKEDNKAKLHLPLEESGKFILKLNTLEIGILGYKEGIWSFQYSDAFKSYNNLHPIPGFPDLNKTYTSESLWPFFQTRIPGLGQPKVKDILTKEKIDKKNESALLKRFGTKTIANPYTLIHQY